ncbi:GNAT family N-acetyltransferase [Nocardioides sp.]|uniref:GNAT family N-acetyltransferase n=1 Tax=Nocardioides sp. TaxID=35761 RepID=UPI002636144F|nr:GNAT family N-acetyltransferase [Nocardioides sp.]
MRDAVEDDVPALVALVTSAYRGDSSRAGWTTEADLLDGSRVDADLIRADLEAERSLILLAEREGRLVGCVHLQAVAGAPGRAYLGMFAVAPTEQGSGLGKQIMAAAERRVAQEWDSTEIEMTVIDVRAELIAFYERRGYRRTGETAPFPYGDERFGTPKRDDLQMAVLRKPLGA